MNKQILIVGGAILAVVVVAYLITTKQATAPVAGELDESIPMSTETTEDNTIAARDGIGTFADFYGREENVHCTFSGTYDDGVTGEGEFWYANERMRVEAVTRADGEVYTSNMIDDGDRMYVWSGTAAGTQAIVMDSDQTDVDYDAYAAGQADARLSMEQEIEYSCEPWSFSAVQFVPPSDIEFVDMEAMMQGMFEGEMRGMPEGMNF